MVIQMNFFKNLFKKRIKVTFHLKSGKTTSIWCDDINIKHDGSNITSYSLKGTRTSKDDPLFWIAMDQIELITLKR